MDKYGIIGYPLGHSFSRAFFTEKFQREHIDAEYVNFEIPSADMLPGIVQTIPTCADSMSPCLTRRLSSPCSTS